MREYYLKMFSDWKKENIFLYLNIWFGESEKKNYIFHTQSYEFDQFNFLLKHTAWTDTGKQYICSASVTRSISLIRFLGNITFSRCEFSTTNDINTCICVNILHIHYTHSHRIYANIRAMVMFVCLCVCIKMYYQYWCQHSDSIIRAHIPHRMTFAFLLRSTTAKHCFQYKVQFFCTVCINSQFMFVSIHNQYQSDVIKTFEVF